MQEKKVKRKFKKAPLILIIEILVLLAGLGYVGYTVYNDFFVSEEEPEAEIEEKDKIGNYGYYLKDRDTEVFITEFELLKEELNKDTIDYEKYAESVVKLFIIDFYSLNNKYTSTDIGGLDYIHPDLLENFKLNAGRTMYKGVKSNLNGDRTQKLPLVTSVTISSITETTYTYNDVKYDAYRISATWTYEEALGYETSGKYVVIKDEDILYIVSGT